MLNPPNPRISKNNRKSPKSAPKVKNSASTSRCKKKPKSDFECTP